MNRTDRLYAIVEHLRARSPATSTVGDLAARFEVSGRTIERDLLALQEAGVPIWATRGRSGGYGLDPLMTLPPLNFTGDEAAAVAVALHTRGDMPLGQAGRSALRKLISAMSKEHRAEMRSLIERVHVSDHDEPVVPRQVLEAVESALTKQCLLVIDYRDDAGNRTIDREVEPAGLLGSPRGWYLIGWCRLREAARFFRLDRMERAVVGGERVAPRGLIDDLGVDLAGSTRPTV